MTEQKFRQKMKNGWLEENIQACADDHNEAEENKRKSYMLWT